AERIAAADARVQGTGAGGIDEQGSYIHRGESAAVGGPRDSGVDALEQPVGGARVYRRRGGWVDRERRDIGRIQAAEETPVGPSRRRYEEAFDRACVKGGWGAGVDGQGQRSF